MLQTMKKLNALQQLVVIFTLFFGIPVNFTFGQTIDQRISEYFSKSDRSVEKDDWFIKDQYEDKKRGLSYAYLQQQYQSIPVYNAISTFVLTEKEVKNSASRFLPSLDEKVNAVNPVISSMEAVELTATYLDLPSTSDIKAIEVSDKKGVYSASFSKEEIPVNLMLFPFGDEVRLVWDLHIYVPNQAHWWSVRVDAINGTILDQTDWVAHCDFGTHEHSGSKQMAAVESLVMLPAPPPTTDQYTVFAIPTESPNHGPRTTVIGPFDANASPFGWHDINGVAGEEYTITRGNNVHAYEDSNDDDQPGYSPDGGASLNFDFPLNINQPAASYFDPAITNLFYMNNVMHDVWYQYGFDEASGNFQQNNYGNGGQGSDYVNAEAQDGGGTNNANFATPPDGSNPRMQMYLWDANGSPNLLTVNSPTGIAGAYTAIEAGFGPPVPSTAITSDLVLYDDGVPDINDGCEAPINGASFANRIVVIRRGGCPFVDKITRAQNEGASAVIIINNVGTAPITMGGTGPTITIPSVMISQANGNLILAQMASGTVNATLQNNGPFDYDGDFDNGIIAHEYGHGISNRLTGGPSASGCLGNAEQMGEGWSDWFGLMLTIEPGDQGTDVRGIGTFAIGEPTTGDGIRPAPYSTSSAINNFTYSATNNTGSISQPHGIGFVWCTMLWDLTWAMIDQYGYDPDLYAGTGGNNMAMELVITGLKLQPCNPGFVDGRDAILEADQLLYNGANQCLIWDVFANRGLGFSASQGSSDNRSDQTQAFDLPPVIGPAATVVTECTSYTWSVNGQTYTASGTYTDNVVNPNCTQTITLDLTILGPVDVSVTQLTGGSAQANLTGSGISYTWLDCNNNFAPIPGQTQRTLAGFDGAYAVRINSNGCIDTSACIELSTAGIQENSFGDLLSVYPNPTTGMVLVDLGSVSAGVKAEVLDMRGRVVLSKEFAETSMLEFNVDAAPGQYMLVISSSDGKEARILIQKVN